MWVKSWVGEAWKVVLLITACALLGLAFGYPVLFALVGLTLYVFRQLYTLRQFLRWLNDPEPGGIPDQGGLWGEVYARISRQLVQQELAESGLRTVLEQFQSAAEALPDAVVALGPHDEILWLNPAAEELLGLRLDSDSGRPLVNLFRAPGLRQYLAARRFDQALELTWPGREPRHLSLRATPYRQRLLLLIIQDVTERYHVERLRRDFVANVSHELKTPLTVISGFLENMQTDPELCPAPWRRPLALITDQAARMRQIVEDLLLLARLEGGEGNLRHERVDVAAMLRTQAEEAHLLAPEGPQVSLNIVSEWCLNADTGLLRAAIGNLIGNAIRHTPVAGKITLHWVDEPDASCILVEDSGEGIAPEHIPRLTERFYRVDTGRSRERGGTGLGLAIVKHILRVHDARLEIMSTPGEGSQFICRFPERLRVEPAKPLAHSANVNDNYA